MVLLDFEEFAMHVPNWTEVNQFCRFTIFYIVVPPSRACAQVDGFTKRGRAFAFASFVESETRPDNVPVRRYRFEEPNSCSIRMNRIKHLEMERHWMLVNEFQSSSVGVFTPFATTFFPVATTLKCIPSRMLAATDLDTSHARNESERSPDFRSLRVICLGFLVKTGA